MGPATNPPLLLWSYQVLPLFRPATAFALWVTIEVLSVLVILLTSSRLVNTHWSCAGWLLAIGLTLYSTPMFHHFWYSQVQLPIVALLMTGFWLWRRGRATGACSFFVLGGVLKLYGLTCAPFPILAASARTRFSMMARSLIFLLFCLCLPGGEIWISFFRNVVPYMGQFRGGRFFSYTLVSFINGLVAAPYEFSPPALIARVTSLLAFGCVATLLIYTWAVCTLLHKANDTETANACFSLLLIATVLCSPVAWSHYLVFLIFPMICLAAEAKAATGWTRIQIGILLVLNLVAINLAGSNVFPRATGLLRHLGGSAPTFGMALLYYHFVKQIRQSARTARVSPPVGLGTYI
ncbi:MAG TPA: glycosyltransferase family 87 protein [Verrucomicrobiae bacterium]|nr:glycosyltransferase family 87 protein [Verrucomicrobiae bacterium]